MYYMFFAITFVCFAFHTTIHLLEHFKKLSEHESIYPAIGISMFFGWFSYFYMAFNDLFSMNLSGLNYIGLVFLAIGFCLFFAAHAKIHKRMHGKGGELITDGVYKYLRHPMYIGEILMLLGAPIFGQGQLTLLLSLIFIAQILIWRYFEEKELMGEFPDYAKYKKMTWF